MAFASSPATLAALVATAFVAGFIDAIAGGGGLMVVPALALAGLDPVAALATNKLQASFGSGSATFAFARAGHLSWKQVRPVVVLAAAGSIFGALVLARLPREAVAVALPVVLIAVALYFALSPRLGDAEGPARVSRTVFLTCIVPLIGCYDGAFGPGTGSFYMLAFVSLMGFGALRATAQTKAANFASNVAGLITLSLSGQIVWTLGFAMGLAQLAGARLGAHTAIRAGARIIRPLIVTVCLALAGKVGWDQMPDLSDRIISFWHMSAAWR